MINASALGAFAGLKIEVFCMQWLREVLNEEYEKVRVLKKADGKIVLLLRHKTKGKELVCRSYKGSSDVYKLLRGVMHPNIPAVYEAVEDGGDTIVLEEYINGDTVSGILQTGLYCEEGVKRVVGRVCEALGLLHGMSVVHRDIKPENIMIKNDGRVVLIDFDAARLYKPYRSEDTNIIGTIGYAAPEQFGITQSDMRADIFALGVLMNVMLTGEHPSKRLYGGRLRRVIEKCIQINPDKRYQSAAELMRAVL